MKFLRLFHTKRKRAEALHSETMSALAVRPAALNVSLLLDQAKQAMKVYLLAFYSLKVDELPITSLEETFYYTATQEMECLLSQGITRQIDQVVILSFNMLDYDNSVMYAIRSIAYSMTYLVTGTIHDGNGSRPFQENKKANIKFINDTRVGWLLSQYVDCGII